jgi:hypothetical protein
VSARPFVIEGLHSSVRDEFLRQAKKHEMTPAGWFELLTRSARKKRVALVEVDDWLRPVVDSPQVE